MSQITMSIELSMLLPTIQVYRNYFNTKYPCTDESNDGSNMSAEDEVKFAIYNHFLTTHNNFKEASNDEYNKLLEKLKQVK